MNSTMTQLARRGARSKPAIMALQAADGIRKIINTMDRRREHPDTILETQAELLNALHQDIAEFNQQEAARIRNRMSEMEDAYFKSKRERQTEMAMERQEKILYLQARGNKEVTTEVTNLLQSDFAEEMDTAYLDALSVELLTRGMKQEHEILREKLNALDYRRPWLRNEEGLELKRQMEFYSKNPAGEVLIEAETETGKKIQTPVSVDSLVYDNE